MAHADAPLAVVDADDAALPTHKPWSNFVGFDQSRCPPGVGLEFDDAFHVSCVAGPRSLVVMVVGDKVHHHRVDFELRRGSGVLLGFVPPEDLPQDGVLLARTPVSALTPHWVRMDQPLGSPWCTVEAQWSTGIDPCRDGDADDEDNNAGADVSPPHGEDPAEPAAAVPHARFSVLSTAKELRGFARGSVLVVTVEEGSRLLLRAPRPAFVRSPPAPRKLPPVSHDGPLRFHPAFRPASVALSLPCRAECSSGPATVVLWGLPPDRRHTFRLELVGAMNTLGMVDVVRHRAKLTGVDVKTASPFVCGSSGRPEQYGRPEYFVDVGGVVDVSLDFAAGVLKLKTPRRSVTVTGFPPDHAFAVTLYASSSLAVVM